MKQTITKGKYRVFNLLNRGGIFKNCITPSKQNGVAMVLMMFLMGLVITTYLIKSFNVASMQALQEEKTMHTLGEAKAALIAWAVSHPNYPGQMPFPDRNDDPSGYDGKSDCNSPVSTFSYQFLLGQLPIYGQTNPCIAPQTGVNIDFRDALGNRLWYAVSRNLVHRYENDPANPNPVDPIINPDIIHAPVYPWFRVLDRNGTLISDRVAAVIIAPGAPLNGQDRSSPTAGATEYLDKIQIGTTILSNQNYDIAGEDFILGEDSRSIIVSDTTYQKPYYFNDKLVFITIDELIEALEQRAAMEAKSLLKRYRMKNGHLPDAALLGSTLYDSISGTENGMLPLDVTDTCTCSSGSNCSCSFSPIASVTMERAGGTWNSSQDTGSCSSSTGAPSKKCVCTGAGSCSRFSTIFSCDAAGNCSHNLTSSINNKYIYTVPEYADFNSVNGSCTKTGTVVQCNGAGDFNIGLNESGWFKLNKWQEFFFYHLSTSLGLQAGVITGNEAVIVGTGESITTQPYAFKGVAQIRPSVNIKDYLDSYENTNDDLVYEATNKQKTSNYNDRVFIVSP